MKTTTIGIDLAKEVFAIHGVDERGHAVLRKQLKRKELAKFFVNLKPCLIGMEAWGCNPKPSKVLSGFGPVAWTAFRPSAPVATPAC